jgi:hypothetical protein
LSSAASPDLRASWSSPITHVISWAILSFPRPWTSVLVTASAQSAAVRAWIRHKWSFGTEK